MTSLAGLWRLPFSVHPISKRKTFSPLRVHLQRRCSGFEPLSAPFMMNLGPISMAFLLAFLLVSLLVFPLVLWTFYYFTTTIFGTFLFRLQSVTNIFLVPFLQAISLLVSPPQFCQGNPNHVTSPSILKPATAILFSSVSFSLPPLFSSSPMPSFVFSPCHSR